MRNMSRNALGPVGSTERWTPTAIYCYERKCVCNGCLIAKMLESQKCYMKASVLELVKELDTPEKNGLRYL